MGHLKVEKTRFEKTKPEWLGIGAQFTDIVNAWAARDDIVAYVGEGAGQGVAAACYVPAIAEMEINVDAAFGEGAKPEFILDLRVRDNQFDHPAAMGAVLHEAMHARHTRWDLQDLMRIKRENLFEGTLVEMFEETRIEARGVEHYPANRSFMRACALKLSLGDLEAEEDILKGGVQGLSQLILLSLARVSAGVLDPDDVKFVQATADAFFGTTVTDEMRRVWERAQAHREDEDYRPLQKLAKEWIKLLEDAGHDVDAQGDDDEGEGCIGEIIRGMLDELGEAAEDVETKAADEASDQAVKEAMEARAREAGKVAKEAEEAKKEASEVFGKGTGPSGDYRTDSRLVKKRAPMPAEHAAAITVARMLEKARYRDRVVVTRRSQLPPGKLNGRAAMQGAVERSRGQISEAEPWKSKHRFHTEDPELKVGVLVDISGSMSSAMEPMAVTAWMLSEAVRRVQGKAAMVYYGSGVFPVLAPGQHLHEVNVYSAPDGTERFDQAFKALNGTLDLLGTSGARLLVIVSDMCYTGPETNAARRWIKRCDQTGVATLVLPFADRYYIDAAVTGSKAKVLEGRMDPARAATEIGRAAAEALEAAGNRA